MKSTERVETRAERERMLTSYYDEVFRYLSVFNIEKAFLEDAIQDTFVEEYANLDSLRDAEKMKYWLLKIAKRVGIRYVTKQHKTTVKECSLESLPDIGRKVSSAEYEKELNNLVRALSTRELYSYINRLNEKERKVLLLYYVYGHKLKDIAAMLGESSNTVKSISRRAKIKLRTMLEEGGFCDEE